MQKSPERRDLLEAAWDTYDNAVIAKDLGVQVKVLELISKIRSPEVPVKPAREEGAIDTALEHARNVVNARR